MTYTFINSLEADRLAAAGVTPDQTNRATFGLTFGQRRTCGRGWAARWSNGYSRGGTSGITHPTTRFMLSTTERAEDGLPWPPGWSLDLWIERATPGRESAQLAGIRNRAAGIAANPKIHQTGPDMGRHDYIQVECAKCGAAGQMMGANIAYGQGLSCCFGNNRSAESLTKGSRTLARRAALTLNTRLQVKGILRQCDPETYINNRTRIWFSCDCPEGGHIQRPSDVLRGSRPCLGARAQPVANGKNADGSVGRLGGLITGTPYDSPWRVLAGERHPSEDCPTKLYLHTVPGHPGLYVFGITNDSSGTPSHGGWYGERIDFYEFCRRSDAVLVEGYFKDATTGWSVAPPADIAHHEGATEVTRATPEEFFDMVRDLAHQLRTLGQRGFAEEFLPAALQGVG